MTNNDIFTISSTLVFHNTYLSVKSCNNGIANIHFDIKSVVHSSPTGTERRSDFRAGSRHVETCQVDRVSIRDNSVSVSVYILVVPVWIET